MLLVNTTIQRRIIAGSCRGGGQEPCLTGEVRGASIKSLLGGHACTKRSKGRRGGRRLMPAPPSLATRLS